MLFNLIRSLVYASIFVGVAFVWLPGRILAASGAIPPAELGAPQIMGILLVSFGFSIVLWCIFIFASFGRGTPFPLDAPRHFVAQGPYRYVRNPMYIGGGLALLGYALYYASPPLLLYLAVFLLVLHLFVVFYEEPTLTRQFGEEYTAYLTNVNRWLPKVPTS